MDGAERSAAEPTDAALTEFLESFQRLVVLSHERLSSPQANALLERLDAHLGGSARELPVITESYPGYDHANVQMAVDAWRAGHGEGELIGISGHGREHHSLTEILTAGGHFDLGAVDYTSVPVGVDAEMTCVRFGVYLLRRPDHAHPGGAAALAVLVRGADLRRGEPGVRLEVLCADADAGRAFLAELRDLMRAHNVFRGQVLSFEGHEFGPGVGPLAFHRRPALDRAGVVLPDGLLDSVERQVIGVARHRDRLRDAGHPLKRGVLLFGPPGTGKTHTVRYLISRLPDFTVVLLSGMGLQHIAAACALARLVQPALVVLEDVDLIAESRSLRPALDNPLLFQVLNEMDGLGSEADVAFVLTTNRADLLEPALAERPGRVDLAVEVPLPDAAGRHGLLRLYGRGLRLTDDEAAEVVANTAGATASFFAELSRRAELIAADQGSESTGMPHVRAALAELVATREAIAGAGREPDGPGQHGPGQHGPRAYGFRPYGPRPGVAPTAG